MTSKTKLDMALAHLAMAERHINECRGLIDQQSALLQASAAKGHDTEMAHRLLLTLEDSLRVHLAMKEVVLPGVSSATDHGGVQEAYDRSGPDHGPTAAARDDSGHGSLGHLHDDPSDQGKPWYRTGKGRLVIFTALLLGAAWIIDYVAPQIGRWAFVAACLIGVADLT